MCIIYKLKYLIIFACDNYYVIVIFCECKIFINCSINYNIV